MWAIAGPRATSRTSQPVVWHLTASVRPPLGGDEQVARGHAGGPLGDGGKPEHAVDARMGIFGRQLVDAHGILHSRLREEALTLDADVSSTRKAGISQELGCRSFAGGHS
jgi:hypothetical protein